MAKGELQQKAQISKHSNSTTIEQIEQNVFVDDSLLPTAEELAKLQQLDSNIMDWMKERCVVEQDARIEFNKNSMNLAKHDVKWFHRNNLISMLLVFFVALTGLIMSYFLISNGHTVVGSIFGATGLAIMIFSMRKSPNSNN